MTLPNRRPLININPGQRYRPTRLSLVKYWAVYVALVALALAGAILAAWGLLWVIG